MASDTTASAYIKYIILFFVAVIILAPFLKYIGPVRVSTPTTTPTTTIPITEELCNKLNGFDKDTCFLRLSKIKPDEKFCAKISDNYTKTQCLENLKRNLKPEDICAALQNPAEKDRCYIALASVKNNSLLCNNIQDYQWRVQCLLFTRGIKPEEVCSNSQNKTLCLIRVAISLRNPSICDSIETEESRVKCKKYSAISTSVGDNATINPITGFAVAKVEDMPDCFPGEVKCEVSSGIGQYFWEHPAMGDVTGYKCVNGQWQSVCSASGETGFCWAYNFGGGQEGDVCCGQCGTGWDPGCYYQYAPDQCYLNGQVVDMDPNDCIAQGGQLVPGGPIGGCEYGWWLYFHGPPCSDKVNNDNNGETDCEDGDCAYTKPADRTIKVCGDSSTGGMGPGGNWYGSDFCPQITPSLAPAQLCKQQVTWKCLDDTYAPDCNPMVCTGPPPEGCTWDQDCQNEWNNWWYVAYSWWPCYGAKENCACESFKGDTCGPNDPNNPCPGRCKEHFEHSCGSDSCTITSLGYQCEPLCYGSSSNTGQECCENKNCVESPPPGSEGSETSGCGPCYCLERKKTCPTYETVTMQCIGCDPVQKSTTEDGCPVTYYTAEAIGPRSDGIGPLTPVCPT